jgi:hypothetical protein
VDLRWFTSLGKRSSDAEPFVAYHHPRDLQPGRLKDLCIIDAPGVLEREHFDKVTKRRRRQLRAAMNDFGHRIFAEDDKAPRG